MSTFNSDEREDVSYQHAFNAASHGIFLLQLDELRILAVNRRLEEWLQRTQPELKGRCVCAFGVLAEASERQLIVHKLQEDGCAHFFASLYSIGMVSPLPVEVDAVLYEEAGKKVVQCGVRCLEEVHPVVSDWKVTENRFRALVTATSDVVYRMSPDWNEMGPIDGRALVRGSDKPSRTWLDDNIHAADRALVVAAIEQAIRTKSKFELEHRVRRADGSVGWTLSRAIPLLDEKGEIMEWFGAAADITAKKEADEIRRLSAERFRFIAEAMPQKIFTSTPAGAVDYCNTPWLAFTGRTFDQLQDWNWQAIIHPDDLDENVRRWKHSIETGEPFELEHRFRRHDGVYRWHLSRAVALRDSNGQVSMWVGSNTDIDDARRALDELGRASRAKDNFLAILSHELRTPLTPALLTAAELSEDPDIPAAARDKLRSIHRNISLEARLIDDLLDLTMVSRGKMTIHKEVSDAHQLIERAIALVSVSANEKQITIERNLVATPCGLSVDPARFQQVIWNLIRNAVKFTSYGGRVSVGTSVHLKNNHDPWLAVEVKDTGIGIDPARLEQIFLPFDQGGLEGDHRFGGLGMGLAIARAITSMHHGRVYAQSPGLGLGSTFVVELPAITLAQQKAETVAPRASRVAAMRLLLVDDHESTLSTLKRLLEADGHTVVTARSVAEALSIADETHDAVISDLGLPDGHGTELMKHLRDKYRHRGIALSGYGTEEDIDHSRQAGFAFHLTKPIQMTELRDALRSLYQQNESAHPA